MIRLSRQEMTRLEPPPPPAECELLSERLIPLNDAARLLAGPGRRRIHKVTTWRWATKGLSRRGRGPVGRIRLETIKVGGTRYTTFEAIGRFAAALDGRGDGVMAAAVRTPRQRRAESRMAAAELRKAGFMDG
jgi:hypothetical protein